MRVDSALSGIPSRLWRQVSRARHRLLMLDYDGTIAPFTVQRDEAWPPPRSLRLLRRIGAGSHTTLALISGRPLHEVERLIGDVPAVLVGEHGWERRTQDGSIVRQSLDESAETAIDDAAAMARAAGWGELIERKRCAVVLHTRALPRPRALAAQEGCERAWRELERSGNVMVDRIDGGVELRARGRDKGTAVLSLLSQSAPGTLGVYVGDDVSDEEAFEVVSDWGFGVLVSATGRPTRAEARLPSCEAVAEFLGTWLATTEP